MRLQEEGAMIDYPAERRFRLIQLPAHPWVLGTLAGKKEDDGRLGLLGSVTGEFLGLRLQQHFRRFCSVAAYQSPPTREVFASPMQREGDAAQVCLPIVLQILAQIPAEL